jgi:hypothetical protein
MSQHDNSYKLLFSHPEMVRDLLSGFVHESWVADLDFNTLEIVSGSYVADDLRDRQDDIVWRLRIKDDWLYLYILLEFQSGVDTHMAVRILTYLGLLYQDLIKQKQFTPSGKLPPVLPIVLYNGKPRWHAELNISELIEVPPNKLRDYTPQLKYLLLDEGAVDESGPLALRNLSAALFSLEKSQDTTNMGQIVTALISWLGAPTQDSLRRAFTVWMRRVLLPGRLPGVTMPPLGDLVEVKTMLAETVLEWTQQWKQQGKAEGKAEGEAILLTRLLTKRFGPLSPDTAQRLQTATTEQLELWADRILDAPTLAAVFDGH